MELPGIDAATIAERADLSKGVIEEMASGRLRWDGKAMEAARNLFAMLHELDAAAAAIAVAPIPSTGLGEAINDRLRRAAAPRES